MLRLRSPDGEVVITAVAPMRNVRVGLFGIGLDAYWPQFNGLQDRLLGYLDVVAERLAVRDRDRQPRTCRYAREGRSRRDIASAGKTSISSSCTSPPTRCPRPCCRWCSGLVCRSSCSISNLRPRSTIAAFNRMNDRTAMTGEWLAHCGACPVPEIANVFRRAGVDFHQVTGMLDNDPVCWNEIDAWIDAARVADVMFHNRLGLMGHYYGGMLDIYSDLTQHCATFGGHIEILEVDELAALRREVTPEQIKPQGRAHRGGLRRAARLPAAELERAARTSVALDALVERHDLGSLAYYYMGVGANENEDAISSIILGNSLLTARGIPVAGEYEVKNVQAMKILDTFGAGGSFTEYYAMDYTDDVVLMGHDGPGHLAIAEGKTKVRPLQVYHGKVGRGLSVEMTVKHGPVTLLSVVESGSRSPEPAGRRRRIGPGPDHGDRQHEQPLQISRSARGGSSPIGTATAPRTTARSVSGTSLTGSRSSENCCGST